jgi:hypothetical protein
VLKETFHIELQSQRELFAAVSRNLARISFPALRGSVFVFFAGGAFEIIALTDARAIDSDVLIIRLDPHLDVLATGFDLAKPTRQLPLFRAVAVR